MADTEEEFGEDFRHIVRVASTNVDGKKKLVLALAGVDGIGNRMARIIAQLSGFDLSQRIGDLTEEETLKFDVLLEQLPELAPPHLLNRQHDYVSGGDLHTYGQSLGIQLMDDLNKLKKIQSYRGIRHERGHKVRGQRIKSNGRSGLTLGVSRKTKK